MERGAGKQLFVYWYHRYSYIEYIIMHFLNKFSLANDVILVHRKLGQKLITMEDFINFHKNNVSNKKNVAGKQCSSASNASPDV